MSKVFASRDELLAEAERLGCTVVKMDHNNHWKIRFRAPNGKEFVITASNTPGDYRAHKNNVACLRNKLRAVMGLQQQMQPGRY